MRQYLGISVKAILFLALFYAIRHAFLHGYVSEGEIRSLVSHAGILAIPGFILFFALGLLVFAPPPLLVASGTIVFGHTVGSIYSLVGLMIGSCSAFLLGRYVAVDFAHKLRRGWLKKIDDRITFNGLAWMVGLRLVFFANPAFNYAASLTSVSFKDYVLGSFIGCLPSVFIISYVFSAFVHTPSLVEVFLHPAVIAMYVLQIIGVTSIVILSRSYTKRNATTQPSGVTGYDCKI
jgi:uncharacterized membrane protein YdjX (TVP38/TMEM64 family)